MPRSFMITHKRRFENGDPSGICGSPSSNLINTTSSNNSSGSGTDDNGSSCDLSDVRMQPESPVRELSRSYVTSVPVTPVENGRGIVWEDATLASRPKYYVLTTRSIIETAERALWFMGKTLFRAQNRRERMIILEREDGEEMTGSPIGSKEDDDELLEAMMLPNYTEGTIRPSISQDFREDEPMYHMGIGNSSIEEKCDDSEDYI